MEMHRGKVKRILQNGKRVLIARSHSVCEIDNEIRGLKIRDIVLCSDFRTIRKLDEKQKTLFQRYQ